MQHQKRELCFRILQSKLYKYAVLKCDFQNPNNQKLYDN